MVNNCNDPIVKLWCMLLRSDWKHVMMTYSLFVADLLSFTQVSVIKPSRMQKFRIVS